MNKHARRQDRALFRSVDSVLRMLLRALPPSAFTQRIALEWGYRYRPSPRVVKLRSGISFNFESVDFIPLLLYYTGVFEPGMLSYLRAILRPGDTVLDVGANIGFHTLESWRAVEKRGLVISIEASPSHAESVRRNLGLNGYPNSNVLNVAVGDRDGQVSLGLPEGGNQGMFGVNAGSGDAFTVALRRIDDLLQEYDLSSLALVKMDIEGSELSALRGGLETLRRLQPAVLIELNEAALTRCFASSQEVVALFEELGYHGWVIDRAGARPITAAMTHECDECLFLPHGAHDLRKRLGLP